MSRKQWVLLSVSLNPTIVANVRTWAFEAPPKNDDIADQLVAWGWCLQHALSAQMDLVYFGHYTVNQQRLISFDMVEDGE